MKKRRKPKAKPPGVKPLEAEAPKAKPPPVPREIPPKAEGVPKVEVKEEGIEYVFCINCGAKMPRKRRKKMVRFCSKCGTQLYVGDVSID